MTFPFRAISLVAIVVASLGISAAATAHSDAQASKSATYEWDFMTVVPPFAKGSSVGNFLQAFAKDVEKQTNGQIKITLRPPGELPYAPAETLATVGSGRVQLGDGAAFIAGEAKSAGILQMPFLIQTPQDLKKAMVVLKPWLNKDFKKFGVTMLFYYTWPLQTTWGRGDAVASLADFKGKKLRASSSQQAYLLQKLGADPVTLTTPEVAPALQRGVVDGVTTAAYNAHPLGWGSFIKWGYLTPINDVPGMIVINTREWNKLPAPLRATVRRVAAKWQKNMLVKIPKAERLFQQALARDNDVQLIQGSKTDLAKGISIMRPYWTSWAKDNDLTPAMKAVRKAVGR